MGSVRVMPAVLNVRLLGWVLSIVLLGTIASCGGGKAAGLEPQPELAPGALTALPKPSALRQVSYTPAELVCNGADYVQTFGFPWLNVNQLDPSVEFSPDWEPGDPVGGLAYACYAFDLTDYDLAPEASFTWDQTGDAGTAWIGVSDYSRDCWSWQPLTAGNILTLDLAKQVDPTSHNLLILPLFTGTSHWTLRQIRVGDLTSLTGHVWQDDGVSPLGDVEIAITGAQSYSIRTDWDGAWTMEGVAAGDYTVAAHLVGWEFAPASIAVNAATINQEVGDFTGTLLSTHTASGYVFSAPGDEPMRGVQLDVTPQGSPYGSVSTWTDEVGLWTIDLPDGDFEITPAQGGWTFDPQSRGFTVAGADVVVDDFTGTKLPSYTVDGYVLQEGSLLPIADVQVNLESEALGKYESAWTDASGYWSVPDLPDGTYFSYAIPVGWEFAPANQILTVAGSDLRAAPYIGTALEQCTVVGYVFEDDGVTPLRGVTVTISIGFGVSTTTNSAGKYEFNNVYEGHYDIMPQDVHYLFTPETRQIYVTSDLTVQPFLATTKPTVQVDGYVYLPDGITGVPDVAIEVFAYVPAGSRFETTTDATGHWVINGIPAWSYVVVPTRQGYTFDPEVRWITVEDVNLTVEPFLGGPLPSYVLDGSVFEIDGTTPVPGVTIVVEGSAPVEPEAPSYSYEAITDLSGHWQLDEVFEDTYTVTPMLAPWQFAPPNAQNVVVAGANLTVPPFLGVELAAWKVDGYIYEADSTTPVPDIQVTFEDILLGLKYRVTTDANGYYEIPLPNGNWDVRPYDSCWNFDPEDQIITMEGAPQTLAPFYATSSG